MCLFLHLNAEGGSVSYLGLLDEDTALVIFLDYAEGKRETKSTAALLGCQAGGKDILEVFLPDALSRILHLNDSLLALVEQRQGNGA